MNNFLITGKMGAGKTTLLDKVVEDFGISHCGFKSIPYYDDEGNRLGFLFSSLHKVRVKNNQPMSIGKEGIPETFQTLGVNCLSLALENKENFVTLDELGKFEKDCKEFLHKITELLDSHKTIIAVLKKAEVEYINNIKKREDVLIIDLDNISFDKGYALLAKHFLKQRLGNNDIGLDT